MSLCFRALPEDTNVKPELQSTVAPEGWFPGPLPTSKEGWVGWGGGIPDGLLKNTLHFPCVDWLQCSDQRVTTTEMENVVNMIGPLH